MNQRSVTGIDSAVGARLRAARVESQMSQAVLGEALGVSFQQIQKYEKGTNRISASRLRQIAAALDVPVTHFYDAAEGGFADGGAAVTPIGLDGTAHSAAAKEGMRLVRAFGRIEDPVVRQRLVDLVEGLAPKT